LNPVAYFLIATGCILVLLIAWLIFQVANWKWRENPGRPFAIGVALLVLAFSVDLFMAVKSADMSAILEKAPPALKQEAVQPFLVMAATHDWLTKLMELFVIPLSVAIMATALIARVDLDLEKVQEQFNEADARISDLEEQKRRYTEAVDRGIQTGILDGPFLEAYNKLKTVNNELLYEKNDFREQFRKFADSGFRHRFRRKKR
jgi:hypothetical protein